MNAHFSSDTAATLDDLGRFIQQCLRMDFLGDTRIIVATDRDGRIVKITAVGNCLEDLRDAR